MNRTLVIRRVVLLGCLGATVAASLWSVRQRSGDAGESSVVLPAANIRRAIAPDSHAASVEALATADLFVAARVLLGESRSAVDPFAVRSWQPEPAPAPPPPPPPPVPEPTAPPLPFLYMGRQEQPGAEMPTVFYLTRGPEFYAVVAGDAMGGDYRFDGLEQRVLRFTYLPLSVKQELNLGLDP